MTARYGALGVAALCWGTSAAATKYALEGFGPASQLLVELVVAAAFLWLILAFRSSPRTGSLRTYALLALLDPALPFLLILIGLTSSTAANASLLVSLESITAVAFAALVGDERITRSFAAGAGLALLGAILVSSPSSSGFRVGDLLFLAATIPIGLSVVVIRKIAPSTPSLEIARYQMAFSVAIIAPCAALEIAFLGEPIRPTADLGAWAAAIYAGIIGLALSNLAFNYALGRLSASVGGLALNLVPLIGVASAAMFLGETLSSLQAMGAALIVAGLAWPVLQALTSQRGESRKAKMESESEVAR